MTEATRTCMSMLGAGGIVASVFLLSGCAAGSSLFQSSTAPSSSSAPTASSHAVDVPMPNRHLTPGAIQSNDTAAICTPGWAKAHRDVSDATKNYVTSKYGLSSHSGYEIDHLIPLEIGGANSTSNLWPEPYNSPYGATQKDGLEDYLHEQVCHHGMPLAKAQHEIAANWYTAWVAAGRPTPPDFGYSGGPDSGTAATPPPAQPGSRSSGAWCTVTANYNSSYGDYGVYVHSNQPDKSVTASSGSHSKTWHTDSSGYADVYLSGPSKGAQITVHVGGATCSTTA